MGKIDVANLTKFQIYLTPELEEAFERYIAYNYTSRDRVISTVFRRAMSEFLEREGFYERNTGQAEAPDGESTT